MVIDLCRQLCSKAFLRPESRGLFAFPVLRLCLGTALLVAGAPVAIAADAQKSPVVAPANPGLIENLNAIPFEFLIRRALGGVDAKDDVIQPPSKPMAPMNADLLDAYKTFRKTPKNAANYATVRRTYLGLLEDNGDPTGMLPTRETIDEVERSNWKRSFATPPKPLTMLDDKTLLVGAQELGVPGNGVTTRLWAVTRDSAKPVIAIGDTVKPKQDEKASNPGATCKVISFRYIKPAGPVDQFLAVKYSGGTPAQERNESYALWSPQGGIRVIFSANERIPGIPEAWRVLSVDDIRVSKSGMVALLVTGVRESDANQRHRPYVLLVNPNGEVRLAAGILGTVSGTKTVPQPDRRGRASPPLTEAITMTEILVGDQTARFEGDESHAGITLGNWETSDALVINAGNNVLDPTTHWSFSASTGRAATWKQPLDNFTLSVEREKSVWGVFNLMADHDGGQFTKVAQFPMAALDGFAADQTLQLKAPQQTTDSTPIVGPGGRIAVMAYVGGNSTMRFDADLGQNILVGHPSKQWVLLESTDRGIKWHLVAESATRIPCPEFYGTHCIGSICWVKYLPDGRLVFGGADDPGSVEAGQGPARPEGAASVWLWDGRQLIKLAEKFAPIQAPLGSLRLMTTVQCEYDGWHDLILLTRKSTRDEAFDCAIPLKLPPPNK